MTEVIKKGNQGDGGGKPMKWNSPEELEISIQEYYEWAEKNNKHITVTGLAWWLDCSRQTLLNYETSENSDWLKRCNDEERKKFVDTIKRAKRYIEMEYESSLFDKTSTSGAIFTLKNNYGWVDKQEVDNNIKAQVDNKMNLSGLSVDDIKELLDK